MAPSTVPKKLSFEEYIAYDDGAENRYELVNGVLVAIKLPSFRLMLIAKFIEQQLDAEVQSKKQSWLCFRGSGVRTGLSKSCIADVCVVTLSQTQALQGKSVVFETAPLLVVEVVSPDSVTRDYRYKRAEYAALEIPEYWIVDPLEQKVTVLQFNEGLYDEAVFTGEQQIESPTFPELVLTVAQILAAGELPESGADAS